MIKILNYCIFFIFILMTQFNYSYAEIESINNSLSGKVITSQGVLGYSACVGGATIKTLPYELTAVTDIYGEFSFLHIPEGQCIIEIESSYFQTLTKLIQVNSGKNIINDIEIFKPKCQNMYTQQELDNLIDKVEEEKDSIILEKEKSIKQLTASIGSMYTQGYLDKAVIEAEIRGELKYDINGDGKVGLEEVIKYLETLSGVRIESLIIFPDNKSFNSSMNDIVRPEAIEQFWIAPTSYSNEIVNLNLLWKKPTDNITTDQFKFKYFIYYTEDGYQEELEDLHLNNKLGPNVKISINGQYRVPGSFDELNGSQEIKVRDSFGSDTLSVDIKGLTSGIKYHFTIVVEDEAGNKFQYAIINITTNND